MWDEPLRVETLRQHIIRRLLLLRKDDLRAKDRDCWPCDDDLPTLHRSLDHDAVLHGFVMLNPVQW